MDGLTVVDETVQDDGSVVTLFESDVVDVMLITIAFASQKAAKKWKEKWNVA